MGRKVKINPEMPFFFGGSGTLIPSGIDFFTTKTSLLNADGLLPGVGRISNQVDLGPAPRSRRYEWRGTIPIASGTIVGTNIEAYIATSNSIAEDGSLIPFDSTTSADKRRNLKFCGAMQVDSSDPANAEGIIDIYARYASVMLFNNTNLSLGTGCYFLLTPTPSEIE